MFIFDCWWWWSFFQMFKGEDVYMQHHQLTIWILDLLNLKTGVNVSFHNTYQAKGIHLCTTYVNMQQLIIVLWWLQSLLMWHYAWLIHSLVFLLLHFDVLPLCQVIISLADKSRQHIPYRNSMMTSVLRDSLGGNCMTTMIATCSVEKKNIDVSQGEVTLDAQNLF